MSILHPYERLSQETMQEKKLAIDLISSKLPAVLLSEIELATLTLLNNSNPLLNDLGLECSDYVYCCTIRGKESYIITVANQQSSDGPVSAEIMMALQINRYTMGIMGNHLNQGNGELPIVLWMLLNPTRDERSPYPYSNELEECFEDPELAMQRPLKPFELIDWTSLCGQELDLLRDIMDAKTWHFDFKCNNCRD